MCDFLKFKIIILLFTFNINLYTPQIRLYTPSELNYLDQKKSNNKPRLQIYSKNLIHSLHDQITTNKNEKNNKIISYSKTSEKTKSEKEKLIKAIHTLKNTNTLNFEIPLTDNYIIQRNKESLVIQQTEKKFNNFLRKLFNNEITIEIIIYYSSKNSSGSLFCNITANKRTIQNIREHSVRLKNILLKTYYKSFQQIE